MARGATFILPDRRPAQYRFTIDFTGSDLADDPDQHKSLHIMFLEAGYIGAYPNNRVLWHDPAFWQVMSEKPDFVSLADEFRSEGHQHIMRRDPAPAAPVERKVGWPASLLPKEDEVEA